MKLLSNSFVFFFSESLFGQLILSFLHFISGCIIAYLSAINSSKGYLNVTKTVMDDTEVLFQVNIFYMILFFLFFTSMAHLFYAFQIGYHGAVHNIGKHFDRSMSSSMMEEFFISKSYHWIEYAISAPVMFVIIALLSGIKDIYTLVTLFGLMSVTMYFGYAQDRFDHPGGVMFQPFYIGCLPYLLAWIIVFVQFYSVLDKNKNVPSFVYPIIFVTFSFFSSFAVVQWYYSIYKRNHGSEIENALRQDGLLHLLSLTSKLTLAYWVLGGVLSMQT